MSVNKNNTMIHEPMLMEPDRDLSDSQDVAGPQDDTARDLVLLEDLRPATAAPRSLDSGNLKLLRALHSILQKRQADAWVDEMRAKISTELEWSET